MVDDFTKSLSAQRRFTKAQSSEFQAMKIRQKIATLDRPIKQSQATTERLMAKTSAVRTGMSVLDWFKPLLIFSLILFFAIGPGLTSIFLILESMNIWLWILAIIIALLLWRNR